MKIISHRGKINKINNDENNKKAINNFMNSCNEMLEIDIQLTKDNKIILFHDDKIFNEKIIDKESNYLIETYNMILLKDVLDIIKGRKSIFLDIKNNEVNNDQLNIFFKELFNILDEYIITYNCDPKSIYICSFYKNYINYILSSNCAKKYKLGIILDKQNINYFIEKFSNSIRNFDFLSIDYILLDLISFCIDKIPIFCYTVNDINIYNMLLNKKYISGIITDIPDYFIS